MPNKNKSGLKDINAAKKAAILGTDRKRHIPLLLTIAAIVAIAGGMVVYGIVNTKTQSDTAQSMPSPQTADAVVTFPASDFADGKARHFRHKVGDLTVKYFILKSSDGIIRAAFDACDVCWPAGKGYYQDGDVMVCRNCGQKFESVYVNEVSGGCNPAPLTRQIIGDKVVIRVEDIMAGKNYFNFT